MKTASLAGRAVADDVFAVVRFEFDVEAHLTRLCEHRELFVAGKQDPRKFYPLPDCNDRVLGVPDSSAILREIPEDKFAVW